MRILLFNASLTTTELATALQWALKSTCGQRQEVSSLAEVTQFDLVIIICPAGLKDKVNLPQHFIAYQLDPYFSPGFIEYLPVLKRATAIWDYSQDNIRVLWNEHRLRAYYVPIGFTPVHLNLLTVVPSEKRVQQWDIVFLGYLTPRRQKIKEACDVAQLNSLFHQGLNLRVMMRELAQTKIALNMHQKDGPSLLETVRLSLLLTAGCCIVSETNSDQLVQKEYEIAGITFSEYSSLIPTIKELIQDEERRKTLAEKSKNWYATQKDWQKMIDWRNAIYPALFKAE